MAATALPTYETRTVYALDDFVTIDEAAGILDRTTSRVRQMVAGNNFQTVYELGTRPTYLLSRKEVDAMRTAELLAVAEFERVTRENAEAASAVQA